MHLYESLWGEMEKVEEQGSPYTWLGCAAWGRSCLKEMGSAPGSKNVLKPTMEQSKYLLPEIIIISLYIT